ncbi:hypothetical protein RHMOL_Rhmol11G0117200 [Rhododendron molle]|uniref:Uncharacterized protein n=1 Tax=Rhododendron molle TaxID=49168 RepID=A0ACC0LRL8_RHOML|nr:hypothetical protein RHMOL_Rhmol11G0117200 [Rhododendron molle]
MEFSAIPTVLLTSSSKAPPPIQVTQRRPESVFHPSVWGDHFLAYASADKEMDINTKQKHQQLKEDVRKQLVEAKGKSSHQLDLIDAIQRLGVAYHFETEIEQGLHQIYETYHQSGHKNVNNDEDLYITALSFRLLRQHGYRVSCDVFNKFKDNEGKFKESLIGDVRGLLSLYQATFLSVRQEDILDEAMKFTTTHLNSALPNLSNNPIAAQVVHALYQPIHKGLTRLESRLFISIYQKDDSHNKVLLDFVKLDFNLLQKLHQKELRELTRWWKALDVAGKLPFARDRLVEMYFWILGVYEPHYIIAIRNLTKVLCLISIIDDIYDASNATIEELVFFNDAIQRKAKFEFEQERGHIASSIECYMKQYGATEEEAIVEFQKRVTNAWKDMNSEFLRPTPVPMPLLRLPLNLARVIYVLYKDGDNYTHSETKLKGFVTLVLVDPVPT